MPEPLPETTLAWLRQTAKFDGAVTAQVLLHLLEQVETLEAAENLRQQDEDAEHAAPTPEAVPVATDEELWEFWCAEGMNFIPDVLRATYNLGRQHGAAQPPTAQPTPPVAPVPVVVPVAVSERLPEAEDCDAEGCCWWAAPETDRKCAVWCFGPKYPPSMFGATHWLPAHAIPLPQAGEVEP